MQHACAGHPSRHPIIVLQSVYIVAAPSTAQYNATIDVFHRRPPGTRNFNIPMTKFWEIQVSSHQMLKEGQVNHIPTGHTATFREVPVLTNQTIMIIISFLGGTRNHSSDQRKNTATGPGQHSTREQQNHYANNSSSNFRNYRYQPRGPTQSHARFDERYNQQYSPPIYPPTPSLNSSFPETLSKSLLDCRKPIQDY